MFSLSRFALISGLALAPVLAPLPARADAVADALQAAADAYAAGDLNATSAQITTAGKELANLQSSLLMAHFPPAPDGWTRSDNTDMAAGMAMIGGGAGGEATYTAPDGAAITLSAYADNMMVQSFAGVLTNPAMIAMMGKSVEINGVTFLEQEGQTTMTLLENRVLLQANGDPAKAQEILGLIDLAAMGKFDSK